MRTRILLMAGLLLLITTLTALAFAPAPLPSKRSPTRLSCEGPSGDRKDDVTVSVSGKQAVIRIVWRYGIGSATVTRESGEWPQHVRLEFRGFGNLESLHVRHGVFHLATSLGGSPTVYLGVLQKNGEYDYDVKEPKFEIPTKRYFYADRDDWVITADLPRDLLKKNVRTLTLSWIDAFRR